MKTVKLLLALLTSGVIYALSSTAYAAAPAIKFVEVITDTVTVAKGERIKLLLKARTRSDWSLGRICIQFTEMETTREHHIGICDNFTSTNKTVTQKFESKPFPIGYPSGEYSLSSIWACDSNNRCKNWGIDKLTSTGALGASVSFTLVSPANKEDTAVPEFVNGSLVGGVDLNGVRPHQRIRVKVKDSSGISSTNLSACSREFPEECVDASWSGGPTGVMRNLDMEFPASATPGTWYIRDMCANDYVSNGVCAEDYDGSISDALPGGNEFEVFSSP